MLSLRVCYDLLSWDVDNSSVMLLSVRGRVTAYPGWRIDSMWLRLELILFRLLFFVINRSRWIELCYYQRSRDVAPYLEYRYRIDKRNALCGVNALTRLVFLYVSFEVNSICNQQRAEEFSPHTRPTWWFDATVVKLTLCRIAVLSRLLQFCLNRVISLSEESRHCSSCLRIRYGNGQNYSLRICCFEVIISFIVMWVESLNESCYLTLRGVKLRQIPSLGFYVVTINIPLCRVTVLSSYHLFHCDVRGVFEWIVLFYSP